MIVAVGVDEKSLQRRLFKFTGCRGRPTIDIPKEIPEILELANEEAREGM